VVAITDALDFGQVTGQASVFTGAPMGISGDGVGGTRAKEMAHLLGAEPVSIQDSKRALYHASLALLSGGLVALFAEAEACLEQCLEDPDEDSHGGPSEDSHYDQDRRQKAQSILRSLLASTANNLATGEPSQVLTGPMARGDLEVVEGHQQAFDSMPSDQAAKLHQLLVVTMARLAHEKARRSP
jgi:predicted short-subunit dehydrogenase-like oxidoreductase (DUF2520 family)